MNAVHLSVFKDFSRTPGPRLITDGDFSGELFHKACLRPAFVDARASSRKLVVDLDGVAGYATSFLDQSFGSLAKEFGEEEVLRIVEVRSTEFPRFLPRVRQYIAMGGQAYSREHGAHA